MEFVEQRGKGDEHDRSELRIGETTTVEPQRPVDQDCENEILRNVTELADNRVQEIDSGRRNARQQKIQDRYYKLRGLIRRHHVRRKQIHAEEPDDNRCPILEREFFHEFRVTSTG